MKTKPIALVLFALAAVALVPAAPSPRAWAQPSRAKLFLTQARLPKGLSERQLVRFAQKNRVRLLRETKEEKLEDRSWRGSLVVSFNRPVGDLEFQVLFYDIEDGAPRLVEDMSTFVNDRTQKTFVQKLKLPRKRFLPNRRMQLVVTVRRQEAGRLSFRLIGEEKRHSGVVSFSDDER